MPTGYTAEVAEGKVTDFRTFALRCARAFGATIMQRDDPTHDLPKMREESSHHRDELARWQQRYSDLLLMSHEEHAIAAAADYESEMATYRAVVADIEQRRAR